MIGKIGLIKIQINILINKRDVKVTEMLVIDVV